MLFDSVYSVFSLGVFYVYMDSRGLINNKWNG